MNQNHFQDQDQHAEALNAYLDGLTSFAPAPPTDLSPDLQAAVTRLFALAAAAGPLDNRQEHPLHTTTASPLSLEPITARTPNRHPTLRRLWTHSSGMAQIASTAAVVLLTVLASFGVFRAFDPSGGGSGNGHSSGDKTYGAVPIATVPDNAVTSSLPYPTTAECTAKPRTRGEIAAILRTAPSGPDPGRNTSVFGDSPDQATVDDVFATFRHWQACRLIGPYHAYSAELMTEDGIRYEVYGNLVGTHSQPYSEAEIEQALTMLDEGAADFPVDGLMRPVTNASGTPTAWAQLDKFAVQTIFPEDMAFWDWGSALVFDEASALATPNPNPVGRTEIRAYSYMVQPMTREVQISPPQTVFFALENGRWLVIGQWVQSPG